MVMKEKALEALHVAAKAIAAMDGVVAVSCDNDNDSGELFFIVDGEEYTMVLEAVD